MTRKPKDTRTAEARRAARRAAETARFYQSGVRADAMTPGALLIAEAKAARAARRAAKFDKR